MKDEATEQDALPSTCHLYLGDCLEIMPKLPQHSVNMAFLDLPYGVTSNKWDSQVQISGVWKGLFHVCLPSAAQIFSATQPFAANLIASALSKFRYDIIWLKTSPTGFFCAKRMPLRAHESLLVFYDKQPTYNAQMTVAKKLQGTTIRVNKKVSENWGGTANKHCPPWQETGFRHPLSYLKVTSELRGKSLHPTQKPLALLTWLISTYTNPGDTVLDPTFGSCVTGVACARLGRSFIGIEKDPEYFRIGRERVDGERAELGLPPVSVDL